MALGNADIYSVGDDGDDTTAAACDPKSPTVDCIPTRPADLVLSSIVTSNMINSIFTPSSNPVSPGPSSPPLEQLKKNDIVPPTRPSSTPFPHPERRSSSILRLSPSENMMDVDQSAVILPIAVMEPSQATTDINFNILPAEIHECILDHLFGYRVSATSKSSLGMHSVTKSWGTALRHSRRKELSELALVSSVWRVLIQERLYRHIKLRATVDSLEQAMGYFLATEHLRHHVKHVEIWFPVFQPKYGPLALTSTLTLPTVTVDGLTNATYVLPADNATLEDAFVFIQTALSSATILTLEGGERRKAPKVGHFFSHKASELGVLPQLPSVQTLVTKGQWNLMRDDEDFVTVLGALPNLKEWHGSYSKPKSKSYISMAKILPKLPTINLTHLNLCLEGDYRREITCPPFYMKAHGKAHICPRLAQAAPALEHLSYTGRVCKDFFYEAANLVKKQLDSRTTRLKSIDLTVKNCCRESHSFTDSGSGIQDSHFIKEFEKLVLSAIRSMSTFKALEYLRIRFVDLGPFSPLFYHFSFSHLC
jgi:hypothetical protein